MKIQICLVSAQAAANLLPALDITMKPEKIVLVVSSKMKAQAANLELVLKGNGIEIEHCLLSDEHDLAKMENELLDLATSLEGHEISLNITGGTKLMSVAAQAVAAACKWAMFYVDADTDRASWIGNDAPAPRGLTEQLRLPHYLKSYGFSLESKPTRPQSNSAQKSLIDTLLKQIGSLEQPLAQLNWLAQQAEDSRSLGFQLNSNQMDSRSLEALMRHFIEAGSMNLHLDLLNFNSYEDLGFVKGGWLELHVMQCINQVSGELAVRDAASNLVISDQRGVKSELDAAFMARNRLFVVECKTARMDKPEAPKANDTLFKLAENCRRIGGLGTRGMLVSYRPLREAEKKLAAALNISIVSGAEIQRLPAKLKVWVRPPATV